MQIQWDREDLQQRLSDLLGLFFLGGINADTPMCEVRARAEIAGSLLGRCVAVIHHEGAVTADIALPIRRLEQLLKQEVAETVCKMSGIGGPIRELWQAADAKNHRQP